MNNSGYGCQTYARAGKICNAVHALKRTKQFAGVLHIEARPIVAHKIHHTAVLPDDPEFDPCGHFFGYSCKDLLQMHLYIGPLPNVSKLSVGTFLLPSFVQGGVAP